MYIPPIAHPNFTSVVINENDEKTLSHDRLSNKYSPLFLRALEYVYGSEGIISSGGIESADVMLTDTALDDKALLDVGCGFGGIDLHLARKYNVTITGVDREPFMIDCANRLLNRSSSLKGRVKYQTLSDPLRLKEFSDNVFDLVFCKQVLYHVIPEDRELYLREMYRVLKPGGIIITEDLLTGSKPYTELVKRALKIEAIQSQEAFCFLTTPDEYSSLMKNAGFEEVHHIDNTDQQINYTMRDMQRIESSSEHISQELGRDTCEHVTNSWDNLIKALEPRDIVSGIFRATKL